MKYTIYRLDDIKPTHALHERYLPEDQVFISNGYCFVPTGLASGLPPTDSWVLICGNKYPAWILSDDPTDPRLIPEAI